MGITAAIIGVVSVALIASGLLWLRRKMDRIYDDLELGAGLRSRAALELWVARSANESQFLA
jgi:hypothetical protein